MRSSTPSLSRRGFLPPSDPLERLPGGVEAWEDLAGNLPGLLAAGCLRAEIGRMPRLDPVSLNSEAEWRRAMVVLSFLGHAYVWELPEAARRLPAQLAGPWCEVASRLGRPPVLSYASYALDNWKRIDPGKPVELGNIQLLQHFLGGLDEAWFILVHVAIEAQAGPALEAIGDVQQAVARNDGAAALSGLETMGATLASLHQILRRIPERCDPYIYYNRVRPFIHGWKNHPSLPEGLIYDGVEVYSDLPQQFRGETGAQSSIVPSMDAALGIEHGPGRLFDYLMEMRTYMPPDHRRFIEQAEAGPSIRRYVLDHEDPRLVEAYNACVEELAAFRATHLHYAHTYVHAQSQASQNNPVAVGTGGTPFMTYLDKHRRETAEHVVRPEAACPAAGSSGSS